MRETELSPSSPVWGFIVNTEVATSEVDNWSRCIKYDDDFVTYKNMKNLIYVPRFVWSVAIRHPHLQKHVYYV